VHIYLNLQCVILEVNIEFFVSGGPSGICEGLGWTANVLNRCRGYLKSGLNDTYMILKNIC
jgi:hypothetical protein